MSGTSRCILEQDTLTDCSILVGSWNGFESVERQLWIRNSAISSQKNHEEGGLFITAHKHSIKILFSESLYRERLGLSGYLVDRKLGTDKRLHKHYKSIRYK